MPSTSSVNSVFLKETMIRGSVRASGAPSPKCSAASSPKMQKDRSQEIGYSFTVLASPADIGRYLPLTYMKTQSEKIERRSYETQHPPRPRVHQQAGANLQVSTEKVCQGKRRANAPKVEVKGQSKESGKKSRRVTCAAVTATRSGTI